MADKPTPHQLKALEHQIAQDQSRPATPSEKRVKLNTSFADAIRQLSHPKPKKQ
jgi:hypothetical protein